MVPRAGCSKYSPRHRADSPRYIWYPGLVALGILLDSGLTAPGTFCYPGLVALGTYLDSGLTAPGTFCYPGLVALGTFLDSRLTAPGTFWFPGLVALGIMIFFIWASANKGISAGSNLIMFLTTVSSLAINTLKVSSKFVKAAFHIGCSKPMKSCRI